MSDSNGFDELDPSSSIQASEENSRSSTNNHDSIVGKTETKLVRRSKWLVVLVIFLTALGCGAATFIFTTAEEQNDFEERFYTVAGEIVDMAHSGMHSAFKSMDVLGTTLSVIGAATASAWPLVTIPEFETICSKTLNLSPAMHLSLVPLVTRDNKVEWEQYAVDQQAWAQDGLDIRNSSAVADDISPDVWRLRSFTHGDKIAQDFSGVYFGPAHFAPVWQQSPPPANTSTVNFDILSHPVFHRIYHGVWDSGLPMLSEVFDVKMLYEHSIQDEFDRPHSILMHPIYPKASTKPDSKDDIAALLLAVISWDSFFVNFLPEGESVVAVLKNTCAESFSYLIDGSTAILLGEGDQHYPSYNDLMVSADITPFLHHEFSGIFTHCSYQMLLYPTRELEENSTSNRPVVYTIIVVCVFVFTAAVFLLYDFLVELRQRRVAATALRTNAIVSAMFPANVRARILKEAAEKAEREMDNKQAVQEKKTSALAKERLGDYLDENDSDESNGFISEGKPIADLFPSVTLMFADLAGFTSWSSDREPSSVFILLETLFHAFDELAERRKVFKVETVGDCYVCVCGLPKERPDHATIMARFAQDCLLKTNDLVKKLEPTLGPGTGDLAMRIGIHSGPVTAGVLRGQKSRFQLFGDSMNTCSRIESNGERNKIHVSESTAQLLLDAGKSHWLTTREDKIFAKGKGELQTYWLNIRSQSDPSAQSASNDQASVAASMKFNPKLEDHPETPKTTDRTARLIDWNTDILLRFLKLVVVQQLEKERADDRDSQQQTLDMSQPKSGESIPLDEFQDVLRISKPPSIHDMDPIDPSNIAFDTMIPAQMRAFVTSIAHMYKMHSFHCFEHASHVAMSVVKLFSRVVQAGPDVVLADSYDEDEDAFQQDATFGTASDALVQFACIFTALIHDVSHPGIPNTEFAKENQGMANVYRHQSIAEQNSFELAWNVFMASEYTALRDTVCPTSADLQRFRSLVVNSILATDIMDKSLAAARNARWEKAFVFDSTTDAIEQDIVARDRKATLVVESLMQASDISHTLQDWQIYSKWNERLFAEMYTAFEQGRLSFDPSLSWYQDEIDFFDTVVIPLATRLRDCGALGASGADYLTLAMSNQREWKSQGGEFVMKMLEKYSSGGGEVGSIRSRVSRLAI